MEVEVWRRVGEGWKVGAAEQTKLEGWGGFGKAQVGGVEGEPRGWGGLGRFTLPGLCSADLSELASNSQDSALPCLI